MKCQALFSLKNSKVSIFQNICYNFACVFKGDNDKVVILCFVQVIIRLQIGLYINHYKIPFRFLVGETVSLSALKALITAAADDNLISSIFKA